MKTIFETCRPRDEVLRGELREDIFAARLRDVMERRADPVYGDPYVFFDNTFPTAGLKTLLRDALGRLTGDAAGKNAVVRLETAFGGGKTHNLIALYHLARGDAPAGMIADLPGEAARLPSPGEIQIAGVVGSDLDPTGGVYHPETGVKTYTLWGELAYQLGGAAAYAEVAESEKLRAAVGADLFERWVGDRPTLIMIDEIARHLRAAMAVPTASGKSNLADQTVAFLMSLL
ncbi:MAG: AAA family ATPase, partial [Anaerolineae bacterium]